MRFHFDMSHHLIFTAFKSVKSNLLNEIIVNF